MKINCNHGFFILDEDKFGDASRFQSRFGLELSRWRDKFTFTELAEAPEHCIGGQPYLTATPENSFAGEPWEIFEANGLIYNFLTKTVVLKSSITQLCEVSQAGFYYISSGLILPGSLTKGGDRINSYAAHFSFDTLRFRYSEVTYD